MLYPILSFIKKKYSRRKLNLLPLAFTLLLYTLLATNRPAIIYRTSVIRVDRLNYKRGYKGLAIKARFYYSSFLYRTNYSI